MKKRKIVIPAGKRYLGLKDGPGVYGFELSNGILGKGITGCGGTTMAIKDVRYNYIILFPRVALIDNKHEQHPDTTFVVKAGVSKQDIDEMRDRVGRKCWLVTYDSLPRLLKELEDEDWTQYRVVCDEFHLLIADASFKADVEMQTLRALSRLPYVTYMSATPGLDYLLEQIPEFKDMEYTQLEWTDQERATIVRMPTNKPVEAAMKWIKRYQRGDYPTLWVDDHWEYSKETCIYLNSVTNIINLIRETGLSANDTNIIVALNKENEELIEQLGSDYSNGKAPLKGEPHKMVTLCTSTAFFGVDFYSTSATTLVVSDCHRVNTAIDVATSLPQIAGRQRLSENPFRDTIYFIYNNWMGETGEEEFQQKFNLKNTLTQDVNQLLNGLEKGALRDYFQQMLKDYQKMNKYQDSYSYYDEGQDEFQTNYLAKINTEYNWKVQRETYQNGIYLFQSIEETNKFDISQDTHFQVINETVKMTLTKTGWSDRLREYCQLRDSEGSQFAILLTEVERDNPEFRQYYDKLGTKRISQLQYKEKKLKAEITNHTNRHFVQLQLTTQFHQGDTYTIDHIKQKMQEVFTIYGITDKPTSTKLQRDYGFKIHRMHGRDYKIDYVPDTINN